MEKRLPSLAVLPLMLLVLWLVALPSRASCPSDGSECRTCIVNQMKFGCPRCVPLLRCMARCLWDGNARSKCVKKCDCGVGGNPKLSDCKMCMSRCKCSCMVS